MELEVNDEKTIKELQHDFRKRFPFLKIEFFNNKDRDNNGKNGKKIIPSNKRIGEVRSLHRKGKIHIDSLVKVGDFEKSFKDTFGFEVQVYRKSGNDWIQTTVTDHWTLGEENKTGKERSLVNIPNVKFYEIAIRDKD